jgi:TP901 family phage tail tape measure protein
MADMTTSIRISVIDAFSPGLKKLGIELREVGGAAKQVRDRFQEAANMNQAAEGLGRFGKGITDALRQPIQDFASLDQALARVSAKTGEARGSTAFEALKKQAIDLGAATKYSAEEVALAESEYAASGRNTAEILASIPSTLSLATAGSIDLARATAITNEALNQFNLTADKTAHIQDVLARADEVSAAGVNDLGDALSYSGATAARMNISLETTSALLASLANAGQKGSTGGTELSAFLSAIVAPSKMAKKALHELGLSMAEIKQLQTDVATGHIDVALRKMATLNTKLAPRQSAEVLDKIFGERGGRAASVLFRSALDSSDKGLDSLIEKFHKADGAVNRTAKIMEDSLAGSLEKAGGALKGFSTQLGEVAAPTVKKLATRVMEAADGLSELAKAHPDATNAALELAATLGALSLVGRAAVLTYSAYTTAAALATSATASAAVSMGALSLKSAGLVVAAGAAGYALGTFINDALGLNDKIARALGKPGAETKNSKLNEGQAGRGYALTPAGLIDQLDSKYLGRRVYGQHQGDDGKTTTGWYVKPGAVPGKELPADVREALASGATSIEEANAFILRKKTIRSGLGQGPAPQDAGEPYTPMVNQFEGETAAQLQQRIKALEKLAASTNGPRASEEELKSQTKILQDMLEEMKRSGRRTSPGYVQPLGDR